MSTQTIEQLPRRANEAREYEKEMNHGVPVLAARVEVGSNERRDVPQTTKIDRPDLGLMMVAQGEGELTGRAAANMALSTFGEKLGEELDLKVVNNFNTKSTAQDQIRHVDALLKSEIKAAFEALGDKLKVQEAVTQGAEAVRVRPAVVKHVELPGGRQRIYVGSLGDSRVYLLRGANFWRISKDSTDLQVEVDKGRLTQRDFTRIDQVFNPANLDQDDKEKRKLADEVKAVDSRNESQDPRFDVYNVKPGDRVVVVNGGLQRNLTTDEIRLAVDQHYGDKNTGNAIQSYADSRIASKKPGGRTEATDLAAVVYTIPEHQRLSSTERLRREKGKERETLRATSEQNYQEMLGLRRQALDLKARLGGLERPQLLRDRLKMQLEQTKLEREAESHGYQQAEAELQSLDLEIPPKFQVGDRVAIEQAVGDRPATVGEIISYDSEAHKYVVAGSNGEVRKSRASIEGIQENITPAPGDVLTLKSKVNGQMESGYEVRGLLDNDRIELIREYDGVVTRDVRQITGVRKAMLEQIRLSEQNLQEKQRAHESFRDSNARIEELNNKLRETLRLEAMGRAQERRPESVRLLVSEDIKREKLIQIITEINELRSSLQRYKELEGKKVEKALKHSEDMERRGLLVKLHAISKAGVSGAEKKLKELVQEAEGLRNEIREQ